MFLLELNISWIELLIGAFLGIAIAMIVEKIFNWWFGFKNLRPLIGSYKVTYKNGDKAKRINQVRITKYSGRNLFIETQLKEDTDIVESQVYFHTTRNGKGWYKHRESDSFGYRELIKMNGNKLAVWSKYTKDAAYKKNNNSQDDPKMFSAIEQSYIWEKV